MVLRATLECGIAAAKATLALADRALADFDAAPENNVFESLEAAAALEDTLLDRAGRDCEGSYNCGSDTYTQEFIVGDARFIATLKPEYNRHDKTYYYVDGIEFKIEPK